MGHWAAVVVVVTVTGLVRMRVVMRAVPHRIDHCQVCAPNGTGLCITIVGKSLELWCQITHLLCVWKGLSLSLSVEFVKVVAVGNGGKGWPEGVKSHTICAH